jgi:type II secretory pathway component GspD/PulD (secretin)
MLAAAACTAIAATVSSGRSAAQLNDPFAPIPLLTAAEALHTVLPVDDPVAERRVILGAQADGFGGGISVNIDGNTLVLNGSLAGLPDRRISVDFKDMPVAEAIRQLFALADLKAEVQDDLPKDAVISLTAKNVLLSRALSLVLSAAGDAQWRGEIKDGRTVYRVGKKLPGGMAPFGGINIPGFPLAPGQAFNPGFPAVAIAGRDAFPDVRVTLKLEDVPLADAVRQLFAAAKLEVEIDKDFGRDRRVTADIKDEPFREALKTVMKGAGGYTFNVTSSNGKTTYKIGRPGANFTFTSPIGSAVLPVPGQNGLLAVPGVKWENGLAKIFTNRSASLPDVNISVEFRNTPLREAIQKLFAEAKASVVVEDDIPADKRVTMTLRDVKFSRALDIVLDQAEAGWSAEGTGDKRIFHVGRKYGRNVLFGALGAANPDWNNFLSTRPITRSRTFSETRSVYTCPVTKQTMVIVTQNGKAPSWKTCPFCGRGVHTEGRDRSGEREKGNDSDKGARDIF